MKTKFLSLALLLLLLVTYTHTPPVLNAAVGTCQRAGIPAYIDPEWHKAEWDKLLATPNGVIERIIINPANDSRKNVYVPKIRAAQAKGIQVLAYVATGYGQVPSATVQTRMNTYINSWGVDGIFFDEVPSDTGKLSYYRVFYNSLHTRNKSVVLNPGVYPDPQYMSISDIIMIENTGAAYKQLTPPGWVNQYQRNRFWHVIHSVPSASKVSFFIDLGQTNRARFVYVTDDIENNPYDRLPTYWSTETSKFASTC